MHTLVVHNLRPHTLVVLRGGSKDTRSSGAAQQLKEQTHFWCFAVLWDLARQQPLQQLCKNASKAPPSALPTGYGARFLWCVAPQRCFETFSANVLFALSLRSKSKEQDKYFGTMH